MYSSAKVQFEPGDVLLILLWHLPRLLAGHRMLLSLTIHGLQSKKNLTRH